MGAWLREAAYALAHRQRYDTNTAATARDAERLYAVFAGASARASVADGRMIIIAILEEHRVGDLATADDLESEFRTRLAPLPHLQRRARELAENVALIELWARIAEVRVVQT